MSRHHESSSWARRGGGQSREEEIINLGKRISRREWKNAKKATAISGLIGHITSSSAFHSLKCLLRSIKQTQKALQLRHVCRSSAVADQSKVLIITTRAPLCHLLLPWSRQAKRIISHDVVNQMINNLQMRRSQLCCVSWARTLCCFSSLFSSSLTFTKRAKQTRPWKSLKGNRVDRIQHEIAVRWPSARGSAGPKKNSPNRCRLPTKIDKHQQRDKLT